MGISVCRIITLYGSTVVGIFFKEFYCLKKLPLYTFSAFKAHTKFPNGKGTKKLS